MKKIDYGHQEDSDVIKLVRYADKNEIHMLKENMGKFDLVKSISVERVDALDATVRELEEAY